MKERPGSRRRSQFTALRSARNLHFRVSTERSSKDVLRLWLQLTGIDDEDSEGSEVDVSEPAPTLESSPGPLVGFDPRGNCEFCQLPKGNGPTKIQEIRTGASAGRRCCATILDAITTWYKSYGEKILRSMPQKMCLSDALVSLGYDWKHIELIGAPYGAKAIIVLLWSAPLSGGQKPVKVELRLLKLPGSVPHQEDIASIYNFPTQPASNTASTKSFRCLSQWLVECMRYHPVCRQAYIDGHHPLPKRVLELAGHQVCLREESSLHEPYVCLSHSWGPKGVSCKLLKSNIATFRNGVRISVLPKTFRDAILVCYRLGFRFIWIDALCIIQDSTDDWKAAVADMAEIYENGVLTIAATASENSDSGCFSNEDSPFWPIPLSNSSLLVAKIHENINDSFGYSPLLQRAWVFQERRLSTRIVHYGELQLIWECCSSWKLETGHISHVRAVGKASHRPYNDTVPFKMPIMDALQSWHNAVEKYSKLKLTYIKDRLPALAAVVKRMMAARTEDTYIAGLWKSTLLQDMMWFLGRGTRRVARPSVEVPTWSWASIIGGVFFEKQLNLLARVVDITYTRIGPAQLGHVADATIVLKGHSCEGVLNTTDSSTTLRTTGRFAKRVLASLTVYEDYNLNSNSAYEGTFTDVTFVFVGYFWFHGWCWSGLVLSQISSDQYVRIGVCRVCTLYCEDENRVTRGGKPYGDVEFCMIQQTILGLPVKEFRIV